jgi:hypothetical protein
MHACWIAMQIGRLLVLSIGKRAPYSGRSAVETGDENGSKPSKAMPILSEHVPSLALLNRWAFGEKPSFCVAVETSTGQRNPVITGTSRISSFWHAACDVSR